MEYKEVENSAEITKRLNIPDNDIRNRSDDDEINAEEDNGFDEINEKKLHYI